MYFDINNSILLTLVVKRDSIVPLSHSLAITRAVKTIPTTVIMLAMGLGNITFLVSNVGLNQT